MRRNTASLAVVQESSRRLLVVSDDPMEPIVEPEGHGWGWDGASVGSSASCGSDAMQDEDDSKHGEGLVVVDLDLDRTERQMAALRNSMQSSDNPLTAMGIACVEAMREAHEEAQQRRRVVHNVVALMNPLRNSRQTAGDRRLAAVHRMLDTLGVARERMQRYLHNEYIEACLPLIYGDEWSAVSLRVLQEHGLTKIEPNKAAVAARRTGKTWSISMFVVAMLFNIPGQKICVFSTGSRASTSLLKICQTFISRLSSYQRDRIVQQTTTCIKVAEKPPPKNNDYARKAACAAFTTSTLEVYPDSVKGFTRRLPLVLLLLRLSVLPMRIRACRGGWSPRACTPSR